MSDQYEEFKAAIRAKGETANPYRLGVAIGEKGLNLPCPYKSFSASRDFGIGIRVGEKNRESGEIRF